MLTRTLHMLIRTALIRALKTMTEKDALRIVLALGQWADNQDNYIEEQDPQDVTNEERSQLAAVQRFVEAGEAALVGLANSATTKPSNLPSLDGHIVI